MATKKLFVQKGKPMQFYLRPSDEKRRLKPLIQEYGGTVVRNDTSTEDEEPVILLSEEGSKVIREGFFFTNFVDDCIEQMKILDIEKYRIDTLNEPCYMEKNKVKPTQTLIVCSSRKRYGRVKYTYEDDMSILKFLMKAERPIMLKGNRVWQSIEDSGACKHSWASMKSHFFDIMQEKIRSYDIPEIWRQLLSKDTVPAGPLKKCGSKSPEKITVAEADSVTPRKRSPGKKTKKSPVVVEEEEMLELASKSLLHLNDPDEEKMDLEDNDSFYTAPEPGSVKSGASVKLKNLASVYTDGDYSLDHCHAVIWQLMSDFKISREEARKALWAFCGDPIEAVSYLKAKQSDINYLKVPWNGIYDEVVRQRNPNDLKTITKRFGKERVQERIEFLRQVKKDDANIPVCHI